jgi:MFS family permease
MVEPVHPDLRPRLPRSLCAAMALQFAAGGAVMPFVSLLLRDRGLEISRISLIFASSSGTLLIFPFLWGMLADRYIPLNRLFTLLNLLACAALAGFAAQTEFVGMLIAFTLFYACFHPTLSLINALAFHHLANPREQFSRLRAWGSVGWIVPFLPISLWMAASNRVGFELTLFLGMGLCLGMVALTFRLPHTPPGALHRETAGAGAYLPAVKRLLGDSNYVTMLASFFLMAGSYALLFFYSPPHLEDAGVPRPWIGPVQAIGVICEVILFRGQAALLRRWNFATIIFLGCVALVLRHLIFALLDNPWILSASYVLAGTAFVFYNAGISVLVNTVAGPKVRATAQTLLVFFGSGVGTMSANWIAGRLTLMSGGKLRPLFLFAAGLAGLAALLIAVRRRQLNQAGSST